MMLDSSMSAGGPLDDESERVNWVGATGDLIAESELNEVTDRLVVSDDQDVVGHRRVHGCTASATAVRPRCLAWPVVAIPDALGTSSTGTGLCSSTSVVTLL